MLTAKTTAAALARTRASAVQAATSISSVAARPLVSHPDSCYCLTCHKSSALVAKRSFSVAAAHPPTCGCPACPRVTTACTCCTCKTGGKGNACCACASCTTSK